MKQEISTHLEIIRFLSVLSQPTYKTDSNVHKTARKEVDNKQNQPSCRLIYKSNGNAVATEDTNKTLRNTLLKYTLDDQQGKSPRSIYIRAKKAIIAVTAFEMATKTTDAPNFKKT